MREDKVMVRLDAAEKKLLEGAAREEGMAVASWARMVLVRAAKGTRAVARGEAPSARKDGRPELLSLFCGAGGLDQGFKEAGFRTSLAFDIDEECVNSFKLNHPDAGVFREDVRNLDPGRLDRLYGGEFRPVGVIGGPPCQSFSVSNVHQREDDPRHRLPEAYARLLGELNRRNPISFFLFENVPGLLGKKHKHRYEEFKMMFERAGFWLYEGVLDAKDYGVPQERARVFIVGVNMSAHPGAEWKPPRKVGRVRTVRETIWGLAEPVQNGRGLDPHGFPVHPNHWCLVPRSHKFGGGDLTEGQMYGRSFRTLYWDKPSWTVAYGHREVHVHPDGHRRLSIYEAMLLQTFPKTYRLTGNMSAQIRLVSEAVPVRLARKIALSIRKCLGI